MRFFTSSSIAAARSNIRKCSRDRIPREISSRFACSFSTAASDAIEKDRDWSGLLSFSSPEADFTALQRPLEQEMEEDYKIVSYASPESATGNIYVKVPKEQNWMKTLEDEMEREEDYTIFSYASPETATGTINVKVPKEQHWMKTLQAEMEQKREEEHAIISYASMESATDSIRLRVPTKHNWMNIQEDEMGMTGSEWSRLISFASPEADFTSSRVDTVAVPNKRIEREEQLPKSYREALLPSSQAIVVTSATYPHAIVHVNSAWEGLCGYDAKESLGKTLKILQGPETNVNLVRETTKKMLKGEELEDVGFDVINYDKERRTFFNRVRMGVLRSEAEDKEVTHFVGILREISEDEGRSNKKSAM